MKPEQITAWALDEASAEERQQLEAALLGNPQDKAKAEETRAFCDFLLKELRDDSLEFTETQRQRLIAEASKPQTSEPLSRAASANGVRAQMPASRPAQTRWRFGVIVRFSIAACAVLGGIWAWQTFSDHGGKERSSQMAAAEEPGIKVQLPQRLEAKKKEKAVQGTEAMLQTKAQNQAAIKMEPSPAAKSLAAAPPPAAVAGSSPLALSKEQRVMTEADVAKLKQLQDVNAYGLKLGDSNAAPSQLAGALSKNVGPGAGAAPIPAGVSSPLPAAAGMMQQGTGMVTLNGGGTAALAGGVSTSPGRKWPVNPGTAAQLQQLLDQAAHGLNLGRELALIPGLAAEVVEADGFINLPSSSASPPARSEAGGTAPAAGSILKAGTGLATVNDTTGSNVVVELPKALRVITKSERPAAVSGAASGMRTGESRGNNLQPGLSGTVSLTSSGPAVAAGSTSLIKAGAGLLTLSGGNTHAGGVTINGGVTNSAPGQSAAGGNLILGTPVAVGQETTVAYGGGLTVAGSVLRTTSGMAGKDLVVHEPAPVMLGLGGNVGSIQTSTASSAGVPATSPAGAGVAKVQAGLTLGASSVELGNYDAAISQYQDVLRTDPYNTAARRGMEAAEKKRQAYFKTAYNNARAKMLAQVAEPWETKVPVQVDGVSPTQPRATAETYTHIIENQLKDVAREPLSTFSIDVDTASYANVRRFLNQGMIPPPDAVRVEELINYFPTAEEGPSPNAKEPFAVRIEMAPCPWQPVHRLARIAIKGRELDRGQSKASNLVFLVDVSGSMKEPAKLPLVQQSLRMLTEQLGKEDHVTMVVYAGSSGVVLPPTSGEKKGEILAAIDRLSAGGSTHGSAGIKLAYEQAVAGFIKGGVNRVILCTDGDFNVGVSSPEELEKLISHKAKTGVFLSVLGFGTGNLKDRTMETLADKGNGNYAYIDSLSEARKVLVEQMSSTLVTIAKDVKIQVEFNPAMVRSYRLIGYENRLLAKEDFNDDTKDAVEIGAGHSVVALYELVPSNLPPGAEPRPVVDGLKYQQAPVINPAQLAEAAKSGEVMTVKLRYKEPESSLSKLIEMPAKDEGKTLTASSEEFKFSAAVAGFGLLLRDSAYQNFLSWDTVRRLALDGKGSDKLGYRGEFLQLIDKARGLKETRQ